MPSSPPPPIDGAPAADDPRIGQVVGDRWRIVRTLGRGGMGVVYEAQNVAIGKRVAIKFIDPEFASDAEVVSRFQREAEAASAVESAHIVSVFDTGTHEGIPYLVMELLRGESLGARLRRAGRMSPSDAAHVVAQVLRGLARAHEAGVIHRDLKPDNVFLVDRDDDPQFAKVLDFGISKIRRTGEVGLGTLTRKGTVLGTPFYMSPEQAQAHADLDERTDLFAVGAILFECLTGAPPHAGLATYEAVIVAICTKDLPDVRTVDPTIPASLAAVVAKAVARDRDARFRSAAELLDALRSAVPGAVSSRSVSSGRSPEPSSSAGAATPLTPPPTKTSWTARNEVGHAPTMPAIAPSSGRGRLALFGVAAAVVAFVVTIAAIRLTSTSAPATDTVAASTDRPAPELTTRIDVSPPTATVTIDGAASPDRTLRGPALSKHLVHVEADGFSPTEREVVLDGKTSIRVELSPAVTPVASAAPSAKPPPHPTAGSGPLPKKPGTAATTFPPAPPATTAGSGGGLKLKENL